MKQHHPLENPSLTPFGFVFPNKKARLQFQPSPPRIAYVNQEEIIARLWDKWNRANAKRPLPAETILHHILPGMAAAYRKPGGDFYHNGFPYFSRDILLLSSAVQWLGGNIGGCFLTSDISDASWRKVLGLPQQFHPEREFIIKFDNQQKVGKIDLTAYFAHICSSSQACFINRCRYSPHDVSARDRGVVRALMWWLGKKQGREFAAEYAGKKQSAWNAANEKMMAGRSNQLETARM